MTKLYQALGLSKRYGVKDALLDVNFTVQALLQQIVQEEDSQ